MISTMDRPPERLLTKAQLSERLGCDRRTIDRWFKGGVLPSHLRVRVGGSVRFRAAAVDEWIAEGCKGGER